MSSRSHILPSWNAGVPNGLGTVHSCCLAGPAGARTTDDRSRAGAAARRQAWCWGLAAWPWPPGILSCVLRCLTHKQVSQVCAHDCVLCLAGPVAECATMSSRVLQVAVSGHSASWIACCNTCNSVLTDLEWSRRHALRPDLQGRCALNMRWALQAHVCGHTHNSGRISASVQYCDCCAACVLRQAHVSESHPSGCTCCVIIVAHVQSRTPPDDEQLPSL